MLSLDQTIRFIKRRALLLALLIALVTAVAGGRTLIYKGAVGSEDNVLFYLMGQHVIASEQMDAIADNAIAHFTKHGADEHALLRLKIRKDYLNEFPLPGLVYLGVSRVLKSMLELSTQLYPLYVAQTLVFGFLIAVTLGALIAGSVICTIGRSTFMWAFALTLLFFGLSEFLPLQVYSFATILHSDDLTGALVHGGSMMARPGPQFSPLGFPPRCQMALLMIAVIALRLKGRYALSYVLVGALSFVHLSSSGLVLAALLITDLFLRPGIFKCLVVSAMAGIALVAIGARLNLLFLLGDSGAAIGFTLLGIAVAIAIFIFLPGFGSLRESMAGKYQTIRNWFLKSGVIFADIKFLALGWLASASLLFIALQTTEFFREYDVFYFWSRLHGRALMIFWPAIIFGAVLWILYAAIKRNSVRKSFNAVCLAVCLGLLAVISVPAVSYLEGETVTTRVAKRLFQADARLTGPPMRELPAMGFEELVIYYGIAKSVDAERDMLAPILK